MAGGKKHRDAARPPGGQSTLERFQAIIRRVVSKDDERSSLVDDIACVVGCGDSRGPAPPGSDLNSVELARRFRTSRTPTREAVVILEKEGLVEILPRRRPRVADLSISEIREIYRRARRDARADRDRGGGARVRRGDRRVARDPDHDGTHRACERSRRLLLEQCRVPRTLRRSGEEQDAAAHPGKSGAAQPAPAPPHAVEPGTDGALARRPRAPRRRAGGPRRRTGFRADQGERARRAQAARAVARATGEKSRS